MIYTGRIGIIYADDNNGKSKMVANLKKNYIFRKMRLIDNEVITARAIALVDTQFSVLK